MNAGDYLVAINNVPNNGTADHAWIDRALAAAPDPNKGTMSFNSTMPYYQPNSLVAVGPVPPSVLNSMVFDKRTPPTLAQADPSLGLQPFDCIVQVAIDGRLVSTGHMDGGSLLQEVSGAQQISLTVLQGSRCAATSQYHLPWKS